jgi:hypothetical protein
MIWFSVRWMINMKWLSQMVRLMIWYDMIYRKMNDQYVISRNDDKL